MTPQSLGHKFCLEGLCVVGRSWGKLGRSPVAASSCWIRSESFLSAMQAPSQREDALSESERRLRNPVESAAEGARRLRQEHAQRRARERKAQVPPPRYESLDNRFPAEVYSVHWQQKLPHVATRILGSLSWEEDRALDAWPPLEWGKDDFHFKLVSLCCEALPSVEAELVSLLHQRFVFEGDYNAFPAWVQCVRSGRIDSAFAAAFHHKRKFHNPAGESESETSPGMIPRPVTKRGVSSPPLAPATASGKRKALSSCVGPLIVLKRRWWPRSKLLTLCFFCRSSLWTQHDALRFLALWCHTLSSRVCCPGCCESLVVMISVGRLHYLSRSM
jgi:hypothetical protein